MPVDLDKLHVEALARFAITAQAEDKQRARELEDLRFADPIVPSDQWPQGALDSRAGLAAVGTMPAVPPRPALTINKLRSPIQQVQNQQRQARLAVEFAPEGNGASTEDAEAFEDIVRAVQADSRAHLARNWAFDRAIKCGKGYFRIETEYTSDRSFDQKIVYKRVLNQFSVYYYPFCQEPDYSDAEWCFVTADLPWPEYRRQFKESSLAAADDETLTALGDSHKGWIGTAATGDGADQGRTVRIAEYYFFRHDADTLVAIETPEGQRAVLRSEMPDGATVMTGPDGKALSRPVSVKTLCWAKMNAVEFLTDPEQDGPIVERDGRHIPIVPVIADESNINGDRRYTGIVRPALDAQRLFNVEASSLAEAVHLGPLSPFIGYAEQFEGFEPWWAQLNIRRFPYLPVNAGRDNSGAVLPLPQRNTAEQPIQAITVSLEKAADYIHDTTGVPPVALGALDPHERSGKAILASQKQAELGTSGYIDNLANMSLLLEGKILRDLIPIVYSRPGRVIATQGDDDARQTIMLRQPFTRNEKGIPVAANGQEPDAKVIDLRQGDYTVAVTVGKSFTTKREEAVSQLGELAQAVPELVPAFADKWVENMDGPGFRQIADRLARAVPPQFQDPGAGGNTPQAMQGKLSAMQQQMTQMHQQMQELSQLADKNRADLMKSKMHEDGETQRTQAEIASRERLAWIAASAQLAAVGLKVDAENARSFVDALESKGSQQLDAHMSRVQQFHDQAHDVGMLAMEQAHEREMGAQQAAQAGLEQASAQGHEQDLAAQQQQAAAEQAQQQPEGQ